MSVNSLLNIGNSALNTTQNAINVTGNNIANVNTDGYSRQNVRIEELSPIDRAFGQLGQGARAAEVYRSFNRFVEDAFLSRFSVQSRWSEQSTVLNSVQSMFNESNSSGVGSALSAFFDDWSDLSLRPEDKPTREAMLANAKTLTNLLNSTRKGLVDAQIEMDAYITQGVREVNELLEGIKKVNSQIAEAKINDQRNANTLLDKRDSMVRELASWIDIKVTDRGGSDFTVSTPAGLPLVDGPSTFPLEIRGGQIETALTKGSAYEGTMKYRGEDAQEYTFEIVTPPRAADPPHSEGLAGTMRVSLDGGKTWLRNDDGTELLARVPVNAEEDVRVKDLTVSFDADPSKLSSGDRFSITPKTGLYWVKPTREPLNITPQTNSDGTENPERLMGGKLGAYFNVRDENIGKYLDKLDALSNSLAWEVNVIHSQGSGTKTMTNTLGSYEVTDKTIPLGISGSGLAYSDRLTAGNMHIQMYDKDGAPTDLLSLDFDPNTAGVQNFDPEKHSLEDVRDAFNATGKVTASIMNGKLQLTATDPGTSFSFGTDSTGLLAGLGINTFFTGSNATDIALKPDVVQDISYINAGRVSADGTRPEGDNATAKAIIELATKGVKISTGWESQTQSLTSYYAGTVTRVGADARTAKFNNSYNTALANDLNDQTAAISGVNLDEEMTNLIKFQHSYTAAAKLITTADQMLQTLLGLKQ